MGRGSERNSHTSQAVDHGKAVKRRRWRIAANIRAEAGSTAIIIPAGMPKLAVMGVWIQPGQMHDTATPSSANSTRSESHNALHPALLAL